jgi:2-desacetyl-2-hydroxyethyl bacteriochlorophyllide A dehydrogenase
VRSLQLVGVGRPLEERKLPVPQPGEGEVLVRVKAAGVCHSDAHYRSGASPAGPLPLTLGHEVAGVVERTGGRVPGLKAGDRVCVHYLVSCGECELCRKGQEQFCCHGAMIGKHRHGGYSEYACVPARNAVALPPAVPFEHGAVMMCSSATALHALRRARLQAGETVAVFGAGGLGLSAVQLARLFGALEVFVVDLLPENLRRAGTYGAVPVDAADVDPVQEIRHLTEGRGVDVALELSGAPQAAAQCLRSLAVQGRAALAGICPRSVELNSYQQIVGREAELIGVSDHLLAELRLLVELAERGRLDLRGVVARTVPLEAAAVNAALDELEGFKAAGRTVILP